MQVGEAMYPAYALRTRQCMYHVAVSASRALGSPARGLDLKPIMVEDAGSLHYCWQQDTAASADCRRTGSMGG